MAEELANIEDFSAEWYEKMNSDEAFRHRWLSEYFLTADHANLEDWEIDIIDSIINEHSLLNDIERMENEEVQSRLLTTLQTAINSKIGFFLFFVMDSLIPIICRQRIGKSVE